MDRRDITIKAPCEVDWEKMTPADKGRFCGECKKVVRNLSQLTEREARVMMREDGANGDLCVRFLYDKHGKIFFGGDKKQLIPAGLLSRGKRAALAAAAIAIPLALNACDLPAAMGIDPFPTEPTEDELYPLQGGMTSTPDLPEQPNPDAGDGGDAQPKADAQANADAQSNADAAADAAEASVPIN